MDSYLWYSYLLQVIIVLVVGIAFFYLAKKEKEALKESEARYAELNNEFVELIRRDAIQLYEDVVARLTKEGKQSVLIALRMRLQLDGHNEKEVKDLPAEEILKYLKFLREYEEKELS